MNDILIFLTGVIIYLIGLIYKACNHRYKNFIKKICLISFLFSTVIILIGNIFDFSDIKYLLGGILIIIFPIISTLIKSEI
ncbi:hypothetical protein QOZ84_15735 [Romboutsia sedimentorum]|uniref:Uncharacterized protein n=1 Tax=Romboutsia sedimentorum TaxID=1368474 RepID=A0ABT7EG36_9FIRM|nr:hypothetical protein [Romboutsia sedimentorum]MDK2564985.1 hypothetical protein [Romboutsia sedimentorum]MDK2585497.1 hypothetical protein [Romboutsia sedimentorum]